MSDSRHSGGSRLPSRPGAQDRTTSASWSPGLRKQWHGHCPPGLPQCRRRAHPLPPRDHDKKESVASAAISPVVVPGDGGDTIEGVIVDGPTGRGPGASFLFNATDVIAPRQWWNTTFHIRFDRSPAPTWQYRFSSDVEYFAGDGATPWVWDYSFPCYSGAGVQDKSIAGCDEIFPLTWPGQHP
ncbi:MAG: hypothetical protein QOE90_1485 [Thermoplasmata archaeon]|jgi:hypothetical protein|nr:hypothetical protein [Thermoplasmata archaeon]